MGNITSNTGMNISPPTFWGGKLRSLTTQFGLNQNPTIFNVTVVAENGNCTLTEASIRSVASLTIGSLQITGIVQSWDKVEKDIAGTGIYNVRVSDTRPVIEAAHVLLNAQRQVDYGKNVIAVPAELSTDKEEGILYSSIKRIVESTLIRYSASASFEVRLDLHISAFSSTTPYRVRGTSMTLTELIQTIAKDNCFDWYVTTSNGVITVHSISRSSHTTSINGLNVIANKHTGCVATINAGYENREDIARTVLVGSVKHTLTYESGSAWNQFWGIDDDGNIKTSPKFTILSTAGNETIFRTSIEDLDKTLNNRTSELRLTTDENSFIKAYRDSYYGKEFYRPIQHSDLDAEDQSWIEPVQDAWWESDTNPGGVSNAARLKFMTDDGKWTTFIRLASIDGKWADNVINSENIVVCSNAIFMKVTIEKFGNYLIMHCPVSLNYNKNNHTSAGGTTKTRATSFHSAYIGLIDKRKAYGPWSTASTINGKTDVVVDSSFAPWTYGYMGIKNTQAMHNLDELANAKVAATSVADQIVDMGSVEVADLPKCNVGDAVGGTNITSINVTYDIKGIKTIYKLNSFTGELGRYQRIYQELVDRLRRDVRKNTTDQYNIQPDVFKETQPEHQIESETGTTDKVYGRVIGRSSAGPWYTLQPVNRKVGSGGRIIYEDDIFAFYMYENVTNLSEEPTKAGRLGLGTICELTPLAEQFFAYTMNVSPQPPGNLVCKIDHAVRKSASGPVYYVTYVDGDMSGLSTQEQDLLREVVNYGEPITSDGNIPKDSFVTVAWTWSDVNSMYIPNIEKALNIFVAPST